MWLGGLTEAIKVAAQAAAYDIPVVPHASGPYSYHYVISQNNCPFQEYLANSADGKSVEPVFGNLFLDEPLPGMFVIFHTLYSPTVFYASCDSNLYTSTYIKLKMESRDGKTLNKVLTISHHTVDGKINVKDLDKPGFGLTINPECKLISGRESLKDVL